MKVSRLHAAITAALAGAVVLPPSASAQEGLEEIVVTATRREQNLQEVPISIVAITGENLEMRGLDTIEDVAHSVPNVVIMGGGGGTGGTNFRVRGIPNVGTYVDGVWQVGTAGFLTQEFVDIDRVEILRGPQGTMFGRDSTGGALRVWTKRPSEEFGGSITGTIGSADRRDIKASLDLPLGEIVQTKWTAANLSRDGYIYSQTTNEKNGGIDQQVLRGDIVINASDRLDFRFNYQDNHSEFTEPRVQDAMFDTFDEMRILASLSEFYGLAGAEPFFSPVNQQAGFPGGRVGEWENRSGTTLPNVFDTEQTSLEVNWDITDNMSLQFLTASTQQDSDSVVDWDNSQYDLVLDMNRSKLDVFSQEIQLTGGNDRIEWLAGVYYWDQKQDNRNGRWQVMEFRTATDPFFGGTLDVNNVFNSAQCQAPAGSALVPTASTTDPAWVLEFPVGDPLRGWQSCQQVYFNGRNGSYDTLSTAEQDGWAVFGEATIHLTDTWDLTLGVRQHDQSGFSQNRVPNALTAAKPYLPTTFHAGDAFAGTLTGTPLEFNFDKLTSRMVLQKQFNSDIMGYLSYSEGFNSGGVSAPTLVINGVSTRLLVPFKPSTLKNTEIGMRSDLAGGRVRLNATVFSTIWADLQAAGVVTDPVTGTQVPTLVTTNVGEAEAEGVEFEVTFLPTENLMFNVNLGLLDTGYTKIAPGTMTGHLPLNSGTEFQMAPDETYSLGFQHTANLGSGATFVTRVDYNYQGQYWRSEPFLRVSGYQAVPDGYEESGDVGFLNLRFTYEPADGNWQAAFFGTNLTNEYSLNSGFFHGIWGYDFATVDRPREAGASLTFRF